MCLAPPELAGEIRTHLARLALGERIERFHTVRLRKDGSRIEVAVSLSPIRDTSGRISAVAVVVRDMTAELQVARERLKLAREQASHAEAESARRREAFLADASRCLASSLDYEATLREVASLAVPMLADYCQVYVAEEHDELLPVALAHVDPSKEALLRTVQQRYARHRDATGRLARVLRTGRSVLYSNIAPTEVQTRATDPGHAAVLHSLGSHSAMIVALAARGRGLGVMSFRRSVSDTPYTLDDLSLAEDLARRCAQAIDNARLYQAAQHEIAERRKIEAERALLLQQIEQERATLASVMGSMSDGLLVLGRPGLRSVLQRARPPVTRLGTRTDRWPGEPAGIPPGDQVIWKSARGSVYVAGSAGQARGAATTGDHSAGAPRPRAAAAAFSSRGWSDLRWPGRSSGRGRDRRARIAARQRRSHLDGQPRAGFAGHKPRRVRRAAGLGGGVRSRRPSAASCWPRWRPRATVWMRSSATFWISSGWTKACSSRRARQTCEASSSMLLARRVAIPITAWSWSSTTTCRSSTWIRIESSRCWPTLCPMRSSTPRLEVRSGLPREASREPLSSRLPTMARVFRPRHSRTSSRSSTGLPVTSAAASRALAWAWPIVKQLVEAQGGRVGVERVATGHGLRFWFSFPFAVCAPMATDAGASPVASTAAEKQNQHLTALSAHPLRVLVVDDDRAVGSTVVRVLRLDHHEVTVVTSAEEALQRLEADGFDVVVSDLGLGVGLDGLGLAEHIRQAWPTVHFVLATGTRGIDQAAARARGVDTFLPKPYRPHQLRDVLAQLAPSVAHEAAA